jgi:hypothetical protein
MTNTDPTLSGTLKGRSLVAGDAIFYAAVGIVACYDGDESTGFYENIR